MAEPVIAPLGHAMGAGTTRRNPPEVHPLVRTRPDAGKISQLAGARGGHIPGVPDGKSRALLHLLLAHATSADSVDRHRWRAGDIVLWDDRGTCHVAPPDGDRTQPRPMLQGEAIGRRDESAPAATKEPMLPAVAALS